MLPSYFNSTLKCKSAVFVRLARSLSVGVAKYAGSEVSPIAGIKNENPTGSALYQRRTRGNPGKVIMGFVPAEWAEFFKPKTGVSGFYTFLVSTWTYLASKEILVMEHNYYGGLSMLIICVTITTKFGKQIGRALDKVVDEYETQLSQGRTDTKKSSEAAIAHEQKEQWRFEGQLMVVDAKRENVHLQREAEYRRRLLHAHRQVKNRLEYQMALLGVENRFVHRNIVVWVLNEVQKSLTPQFLDGYMERCITDLDGIAKKQK